MKYSYVSNCLRGAGWSAALCGLAFAASSLADAAPNQKPKPNQNQTQSLGFVERGAIASSLYRGAVVPVEGTVITTPNNCAGELALSVRWDQSKDVVQVQLRGTQALSPSPNVDRTLGVDFEPNPSFPEAEDIVGGRYQLWLLGAAGPILPFYYDPNSFELLGGGADFSPPPDAIVLNYPSWFGFPTPFFQPSTNGSVRFDWSFPYSSPHRGDRPEFGYHTIAWVPPSLCEVNKFRIDQTTLRPWISAPVDRVDARPWSDYLRGGLVFMVTVEPGTAVSEPPRSSLISSYSGTTVVGGGIPHDWELDLDAYLAGLAPPIKPWPDAGQCAQYFGGFHTGPNNCEPL